MTYADFFWIDFSLVGDKATMTTTVNLHNSSLAVFIANEFQINQNGSTVEIRMCQSLVGLVSADHFPIFLRGQPRSDHLWLHAVTNLACIQRQTVRSCDKHDQVIRVNVNQMLSLEFPSLKKNGTPYFYGHWVD